MSEALRAPQQARQQEAVARLGLVALNGATFDEMVALVIEEVGAILEASFAGIVEWLPESAELLLINATNLPPAMLRTQRFPATLSTPMGITVLTDAPAVIEDWATETRFEQSPAFAQLGIQSGSGTVIKGHGRPFGALGVLDTVPRTFHEDQLAFLQGMANVLGSVIERDRSLAEIRRTALTDRLTGLPNRALLEDRLATAVERCRRDGSDLAVLFVDLDAFKLVNDLHGHSGGDELLRAVGERLHAIARAEDTVARFGGDEFVIVCAGLARSASADAVARRFRTAFEAPFEIGGVPLRVRASIGIVTTEGSAPSAEDLIVAADAAMYASKQEGSGGYVVFDGGVRARTARRLEVERALRDAVQTGAVVAVFQPIVEIATERRIGVEALCRLTAPDGARQPGPDEFIPAAERNGLVSELGAQVLRAAVAQVAVWRAAEPDLHLAVNASPDQLRGGSLPALAGSILEEFGLPGSALTFELTETALLRDDGATSATMRELRSMGIGLALDDFGTGYSSISHLQQFPITEVKIDRSFVAGLLSSGRNRSIVSAIVGLADGLDLRVVAEGVESTEERDVLAELGCRVGQGYLWGRPQPGADSPPAVGRAPGSRR